MREFLKYCAQIPYNSAARALPPEYRESYERWGLDCVGFAELTIGEYPQAVVISGVFRRDYIHVATVVDGFYVDPFLRMSEPLSIVEGQETRVGTYFADTVVYGRYDPSHILAVKQVRFLHKMNTYKFNLEKQESQFSRPSRRNSYVFLHNKRPVFIRDQRTLNGSEGISVTGVTEYEAEQLLMEKYGIGLSDIYDMFSAAQQHR